MSRAVFSYRGFLATAGGGTFSSTTAKVEAGVGDGGRCRRNERAPDTEALCVIPLPYRWGGYAGGGGRRGRGQRCGLEAAELCELGGDEVITFYRSPTLVRAGTTGGSGSAARSGPSGSGGSGSSGSEERPECQELAVQDSRGQERQEGPEHPNGYGGRQHTRSCGKGSSGSGSSSSSGSNGMCIRRTSSPCERCRKLDEVRRRRGKGPLLIRTPARRK